MPRTKRKSKKKEDNQFNKSALDQEIVQDFSHYVDKKIEQMQTNLKIREESIHLQFKTELEVKFIKFHKYFNTPLTELKTVNLEESNLRNITRRPQTVQRGSAKRRSISQDTVKISQKEELRSKSVVGDRSKPNAFVTPANLKGPFLAFQTITPKVNPNTPQVIYRRPMQGEMAVSMHGSPLVVGPVIGDYKPNVNIPLINGRVLSVQPERGMRVSLIPTLDEDTREQIALLRDHLEAICDASKQSKSNSN